MFIQLQGLLSVISILDLVDVAVVAYFLYRIYLILKNTRGAALIKGILVMIFAMLLSRWMNLHVVSWLLEKSITVLLLALPVVFKPELRRGLEQIGRGELFRKGTELDAQELEKMLNAVVSATKTMSQRKLGALMVFERETGLEERIETGVTLDAVLSDSLLLNIFEKDTPLHDGAAVIRGNRIVAASCLLPLTENRNLSQELGTRHRAALGISEQSDAMVLVVSEETGTVSIARNGDLIRYLTMDDVKVMLRTAIARPRIKLKDYLLEKTREWYGGNK